MVWTARLIGLLVSAFTAYGMISGDRELLAKVWSLINPAALALIAWAAGNGVFELLRKIRIDHENSGRSQH